MMADRLEDIRTRVTLQEHGLINVSFTLMAARVGKFRISNRVLYFQKKIHK